MILSDLLRGVTVTAMSDGAQYTEVSGISTDSRTVRPGEAFVAIRGTHTDGAEHIPEALSKGAKVCIVTEAKSVPDGAKYVAVPDTRIACAHMWSSYYGSPGDRLRIIAVTGTCGKTTTSMILHHILKYAGYRTGVIGTLRSLIGDGELVTDGESEVSGIPSAMTTPDPKYLYGTLRKMADAGCDTVILEASSHALAQHKLDPLRPYLALFTNLSPEHLDFHPTMEDYLRAKAHLFALSEKGIVNAADPAAKRIHDFAPDCGIEYVAPANADMPDGISPTYTYSDVSTTESDTSFTFASPASSARMTVPLPGGFTAANASLAASAAALLGVPADVIKKALGTTPPIDGRMEIIHSGAFTVMRDFAHTPASFASVLTAVRPTCRGKLICVFGCGGDRDRTKRAPMGEIAAALSDYTVITSDNSRTESPSGIIADILAGVHEDKPHTVIPDRREAIAYALSVAKEGDLVILLGKGHETYEIDRTGKHPFDERKIVRDILRQYRTITG